MLAGAPRKAHIDNVFHYVDSNKKKVLHLQRHLLQTITGLQISRGQCCNFPTWTRYSKLTSRKSSKWQNLLQIMSRSKCNDSKQNGKQDCFEGLDQRSVTFPGKSFVKVNNHSPDIKSLLIKRKPEDLHRNIFESPKPLLILFVNVTC